MMNDDKKPKKAVKKKKPVEKLNMGINEFGELTTNINLEEINNFLDKNVEDKKLNEKKNKS
jgi:hypothetical protein